jgi:hypothetical protein
MKIRFFFCLIVLCFAVVCSVMAKKKSKKKTENDFTLIEAYSQRTIPGARRAIQPPPVIHFIIVWQGMQYPDAFFWRADTGLVACNVVEAHKVINKPLFSPAAVSDYYAEIKKEAIKKGDTLDIIPMRGGKARGADSIHATQDVKNTLFFRTGVSEWRKFHIDSIMRKRDIVMP